MKRLLIISPGTDLLAALQQGLKSANFTGKAAILRQYPAAQQLGKLLEASQAKAVIVSLGEAETALRLIEEMRASHPEIPVAASHTVNTAPLILSAVRAGAAEYLGLPLEAAQLERLLGERAVETGSGNGGGRLIAFLPAGDGSGASTTALHVAAALAQQSGKRVLLADCDFQTGTLDFRLRLKPEYTFADAVRRGDCLGELWGQIPCRWKGIDLLAAPPPDAGMGEDTSGVARVFRSARKNYEWIVADLSSSFTASSRELLKKADSVYLVCTPDPISMHLARRKVQQLRDWDVEREAVRLVVNRASDNETLNAKETSGIIGIPVACLLGSDYKSVCKATFEGRLIPEDCALHRHFRGLARDIMGVPAAGKSSAQELARKTIVSMIGSRLTEAKDPAFKRPLNEAPISVPA